MKPTNEALKNYQLSDISYDKSANLAKATFTEDLTSNDKSSLKEIIVDIFDVKPGWVGQNGMVLNIPEKEFNNFQKLLILDLQMKLADEEVTNENSEGEFKEGDFVTAPFALGPDGPIDGETNAVITRIMDDGEVEMQEYQNDEPVEDGFFYADANTLKKWSGPKVAESIMESFSSSLKRSLINEAKDADDNDIVEGDEVLVVGRTEHEGKKGTIVETSDSSDFVIVEIKGKNYSYHASDLRKVEESEEDDEDEEDFDAANTYDYVIDLDERGDFRAHVEDNEGDTVFEIEGIDDLESLIDDGFMKHKDDTDGLLKHLQEIGVLDQYAILETLDTRIDKFIKHINEDMGDDDALSLDNSEPEYEVFVTVDGPMDTQRAAKIAQKLEIEGSPDTGFVVATKVLLRKLVNTLQGFDLAVSKILDGHNNEVALASIEPYKQKGRPTNKYNYPNRMREDKTNESYTLDQAKADFESDGRVHFHGSDEEEMKVFYALIEYLKEQGINYGETNVTPEQYTLYNADLFDSGLRRIKK